MPLSRPAVPLVHGPRAAADARRWVVEVCAEIGRSDLAENAELALSELVTNAILHARPPLSVRLRGTVDHPRVEVHDHSQDPPALPATAFDLDAYDLDAYDLDSLDDLDGFDELEGVSTVGRGLSIVALSSEAWGADRGADGKVVWFVPAADGDGNPVAGVLTGWDDVANDDQVPPDSAVTVRLRHVPVDLLSTTLAHNQDLRRELRLLALAHQDTYPVAADLSEFFSALERDVGGQIAGALADEQLHEGAHIDMEVHAPADAEERFTRLCELLDLADIFCRHERLLTLARTPEQESFQDWFFGEFARQAAGARPTAWADPHWPHRLSRGF